MDAQEGAACAVAALNVLLIAANAVVNAADNENNPPRGRGECYPYILGFDLAVKYG